MGSRKIGGKKRRKRSLGQSIRVTLLALASLTAVLMIGVLIGKNAIVEKDTTGQKYEKQSKGRQEKEPAWKSDRHSTQSSAGRILKQPASESSEAAQVENTQTESAQEKDVQAENTHIRDVIRHMTIEEKVAQLFVLTPEMLTGISRVTAAGEITKNALDKYPIGGFAYLAQNINSEGQFQEMAQNVQKYSMERTGMPAFLCVDEEGGTVARISGRGIAGTPNIPDMCEIGASGEENAALQIGKKIGSYLARFQVNVDFAPVADVYTNPDNTVVQKRSFGSNPSLVASMVENEVKGLKSQNIAATLKHFPGHGDTSQDSHKMGAYCYKTMDELRKCELVPFQAGIKAGADFVMAGHIMLPNATADGLPASLSHTMITDVLRGELGFEGIVITDALGMGAISNSYSSADAAVLAVKAGVDLLLMPADFLSAYERMLAAVRQGEISEERIDESLERIFRVKMRMKERG